MMLEILIVYVNVIVCSASNTKFNLVELFHPIYPWTSTIWGAKIQVKNRLSCCWFCWLLVSLPLQVSRQLAIVSLSPERLAGKTCSIVYFGSWPLLSCLSNDWSSKECCNSFATPQEAGDDPKRRILFIDIIIIREWHRKLFKPLLRNGSKIVHVQGWLFI